jgi:hypothetical protein
MLDRLSGEDFAFLMSGLGYSIDSKELGVDQVGHNVDSDLLKNSGVEEGKGEVRPRTTFRVSVKVAVSLPIEKAPTSSGPSAVRAYSVGKLPCRYIMLLGWSAKRVFRFLSFAVSRW